MTQNVEELEQLADNITAGWESEITVVTETIFPKDKLYNALEQFYPQARGTRVRIEDEVLTGTKERILEHSADIVFVGGDTPKGFPGNTVERVAFGAYCGTKHPLANSGPISLDELTHELQIVISDTSKTPQESHGWLKAEQRWTVSHFYQAIEILERGTGFCWIPNHIAQKSVAQGNLKELNLTALKNREVLINMVTPRPNQLGPGATLLRDLILQQYE